MLGKQVLGSSIRISSLVKRFGEVLAVNNVSLDIESGKFLTLLGPSGSGKTTILKVVAGFERQTAGEVYINGEPMRNKPPFDRNVGMVFQNYALFPHMTVGENIAFPLKMRKVSAETTKRQIERVLEMVQLSGYETRYPKQLSGGQQQRIALARALVFSPSVLLMDEPLGALDKKLREHMQIEIKRIQKELNMTVIYVTHDQSEALNMSDLIAVMNEGALQQLASPRDMYENPHNVFVADFIGESNFIRGTICETESDFIWLKTESGDRLRAVSDKSFTKGDEVVVTVHPEKVRVFDKVPNGMEVLKGTVTEVVYLGEITKYYVRLDTGNTVFCKHHNRSDISIHGLGDSVFIGWALDDSRLLHSNGDKERLGQCDE